MEEVREVSLEWRGQGSDVLVAGEFSNWVGLSMVRQADKFWNINLKLKHGEYMCKFIVDGDWENSTNMDNVTDDAGNENNLLVVEPISSPWKKTAEDAGESFPQNEVEVLDFDDNDVYFINETPFEYAAHSLESEVDTVTDYLNEVNQNKEEISEVTLKWKGYGNEVNVSGEFSNWEPLTMTNEDRDLWKIRLKLKNGQHMLKYIVDGDVVISEYMEKVFGHGNEVFNLLNVDSNYEEDDHENKIFIDDESHSDHDEEVRDVIITWKGLAENVMVSGDFSNWIGITMANVDGDVWNLNLKLKHGQYFLMFFVDGEIILSDSMEQVTGDDEEDYNMLIVESKRDNSYKKYSTFDNVPDCVTIPINDEMVNESDISNLEIGNKIMHGKEFPNIVTVTQNSELKELYTEANADAWEPHVGNEGFLHVDGDSGETEVKDTEVVWKGEANDIKVSGEFSNWEGLNMANFYPHLWKINLKLRPGIHKLKFIVDEKIEHSETDDDLNDGTQPINDAVDDSKEFSFPDKLVPDYGETEVCENTIYWKGHAKDVKVIGEFSDWFGLTMSKQTEDVWSITLKQKVGSYLLKFIVDGKYVLSEKLQKVIGPDQEVYNLLNHNVNKLGDNLADEYHETHSETDSVIFNEDDTSFEKTVFNPFDDNFVENLTDCGYNAFVADMNDELSIIYEEDSLIKIENSDVTRMHKEISDDLIQSKDYMKYDSNGEDINIKEAIETSGSMNIFANDGVDTLDTMDTMTNEKQIDIKLEQPIGNHEMNDDSLLQFFKSPHQQLNPFIANDEKENQNNEVVQYSVLWKGFADDVRVIADFSNWEVLTMSNEKEDIWKIDLKLKVGQHLLKFIVNGKYILSEHLEKAIGPDDEVYNLLNVSSEIFTTGQNMMIDELDSNYLILDEFQTISDESIEHIKRSPSNPFNDSFNDSLKDSGNENSLEYQKTGMSSDEDTNFDQQDSFDITVTPTEMPELTEETSDLKASLTYGDHKMIKEAVEVSGSILRAANIVFDRRIEEDLMTENKGMETKPDGTTSNQKTNECSIPIIRETEQLNVFLGCSKQSIDKDKDIARNMESVENEILHNNIEVVETSIQWEAYAKDVKVIGDFSNWEALNMSKIKEDMWRLILKQKTGQYLLQFIVDGKFTISDNLEKAIGPDGEVYNLLEVPPVFIQPILNIKTDNYNSKHLNANNLETPFSNETDQHSQEHLSNSFKDSFSNIKDHSSSDIILEDIKQEIYSDEEKYFLQESLDTKLAAADAPDISQNINGYQIETHNISLTTKEAVEISATIQGDSNTDFGIRTMTDSNVTELEPEEATGNQKTNEFSIPIIRETEQLNVFLGCTKQIIETKEDYTLDGDIFENKTHEVVETTIEWEGVAKDVNVIGDFSNWEALTMSNEKDDIWTLTLKLKTGQFLLKFIVDGEQALSENLEKVIGSDQKVYNLLDVVSNLTEVTSNKFISHNLDNETNNFLNVFNVEPEYKTHPNYKANCENNDENKETYEVKHVFHEEENMAISDLEKGMDAVNEFEKTLGITDYVLKSNTNFPTSEQKEDDETGIPLFREKDEQLNVFLGSNDYSNLYYEQGIPVKAFESDEIFEKEETLTSNSNPFTIGNEKDFTNIARRLDKERIIEADIIEAEEISNNIFGELNFQEVGSENIQLEQEKKSQEQMVKLEMFEKEKEMEKETQDRERIEEERNEKDKIELQRKTEKEKMEKEKKMEEEKIEIERKSEEKRIKEERKTEEERVERGRIEIERSAEVDRVEKERIERKAEEERIKNERMEMNRKAEEERIENDRIEQGKKAQEEIIENERIETERKAEEDRVEKERIAEAERVKREKIEKERKAEEERIEEERKTEEERVARERIEIERKAEEDKVEKERIEIERKAEEERIENERIEMEIKAEEERIENNKIEQEKKAEEERIENYKIEQEKKAEEERIENERIEMERKAEEERVEKERIEEAERVERETIEKERKAEEDRIDEERKIEEERVKRERIEIERKAEEDKVEKERIEKEKKAEEERILNERIEMNRKEEEERIENDRIEQEKKAKEERIEKERIEMEKKAEDERVKREEIEKERKAEEKRIVEERKTEEERVKRERIEIERKAKEDRIEKERIEIERKAEEERIGNERIEIERKAEEERIEKYRIEQEEKAEEERAEQEKMQKVRIAEAERVERERIEQERKAEEERIEEETKVEEKRAEEEKIEKERNEKERKAAKERIEKEIIEQEIIAEEHRIKNETIEQERKAEEERFENEKIEKERKLENERLEREAEERAIVEDIRIQMLIDKNNQILQEEKEREEKEKARLAREAEERVQVEEQIRKEEEKLEMLRLEKENEEQIKKKDQDTKRIQNFIETNNKTLVVNEKQMALDESDPNTTQQLNGENNVAFVINDEIKVKTEIEETVPNGNNKFDSNNIKTADGKETRNGNKENATKEAIEQAKNAAEVTVANIEEVLMKKQESKDISNGTFEPLDVESGETSLDCRKKNNVVRKMVKLCQCNIL